MKAKTVLVIPDTHVTVPNSTEGGIDPKAESVLFQAIDIVRPNECVHIGDVGEWSTMSHWQWKRRKRPPTEWLVPLITAETAAINLWLNRLQSALGKAKCNKLTITEGNHEVWCNNFAEEEARPEYTAYNLMNIKTRGIEWHAHGKFAKIGKLHATHGGHFTGLHHAYKTVLGLSASCMYGHFHNTEFAHVMHLGGAFGAWCIGCLCKLDKKFLNNRPTNWSHALGIVHVESDGRFHVEVVDIYDGVGYVYGKRLEAK
jgi:hypothetical protein